MNSTENKSAVITGASSGIGHASVLQMIESGWRVFATVRKPEEDDRLRSEFGPRLMPVKMDVTDRGSIIAAARLVATEVGSKGLDGLVNVAGIGMVRPVEFATDHDLEEIFDINVFGQLAVTRAFLPLLRKAHGRIVNISSVGAHIAVPFGSMINASKAAFGMFSDTLRLELHPFGIHVSVVEPGAIKTPAVEKTLGSIDTVIANLPDSGAVLYGPMIKKFAARGYEREMNGSSPDVVARAIHHALTARKPRLRYRAGKHATLLTTLPRVLSDRLLTALLLRIAGMPTRFGAGVAPATEEQGRAA